MGSGVCAQGPDHLTFDLADAPKKSLSFYGKRPGPGTRPDKPSLQFAPHDAGLIGDVLDGYERMIQDACVATTPCARYDVRPASRRFRAACSCARRGRL